MREIDLKCPSDFNHNCPEDWDADYKSIWAQLQVQQHNKMQYRKAWKEAESELTAARDEAERLRARVASLESRICRTCDGHGMIGGPSYSQPDEGGEPCPECEGVDLLRRAEAVEDAYKSTVLSTKGDHPQYEKGFDDAMNQYDRQMEKYVELLRQQAESIENGE